jgi:hypothetical protein
MFVTDFLPRDFVENYQSYVTRRERPLVAWTGIIVERREFAGQGGTREMLVVRHHYWDWNTTTDDHLIFVSDQGEGLFQCGFNKLDIRSDHAEGQFVIIYGIPFTYHDAENLINMECMNSRILDRRFFTTDAWRYGRAYALKGDVRDIQVLDRAIR